MRLLDLYQRILLRKPRVALLCVLAVVAYFGYWIQDFRLDASSDSLVLEHDEDLRYSREVTRRYAEQDFVIVTYSPAADLFAPDSLESLKRLRNDLAGLDRVSAVTSILDVPLLQNPPVPLPEVTGNLKTLEDPLVDVQLAKEELRTSPLFRGLLVSKDLKSTALQVSFQPDSEFEALSLERDQFLARQATAPLTSRDAETFADVQARYDLARGRLRFERHQDIAAIRAILKNYRDGARIYLGGVPMIVDDIIAFIRNDLIVFGFAMTLLLILTLGMIFRRPRWVILPMLCCSTSAIVMIGLLGLIGWEVTVVSSNFVSLQLIFTMSLTIHLIVRYRELLRLGPDDDNLDLVRNAVRYTFVPCLYASLTTIAGFTSLVLCDILPVVTFGWMMTVGIAVSLVVTFTVFPPALLLMKKLEGHRESDFGIPLTGWFANLTERRGTAILLASALFAVATTIGISRLEVENSFIDYFKESTEIYQGMAFIDRELGGTTPLEITLDFKHEETPEPVVKNGDDDEFAEFDEFESDSAGDREKYWYTTTKMERIASVHDYLDQLPATGKVLSLATLAKIGEDINDGEPLDDVLLAILFQQMPDEFKESVIRPYAAVEHDEARISVRIEDSQKTLRRDALLKEIEHDLMHELGLREGQFRITGLMVLYNNMLQSLFSSQVKTIGYAVLALLLMFMVLFRSVMISFIAIFPSLLASLVILGIMGLAGIPLDVMTITIVAISVGIAVDDTIHYLHRFRREFAVNASYLQTMHKCHRSIGNAMYYTSITITIGFSILSVSNFIPSVLFGLLTALAMMMALVSALSLLPRLIFMFQPFGPEKETTAARTARVVSQKTVE